jgi:hypothetical protein
VARHAARDFEGSHADYQARSFDEAIDFATNRSFLSTARKQAWNTIDASDRNPVNVYFYTPLQIRKGVRLRSWLTQDGATASRLRFYPCGIVGGMWCATSEEDHNDGTKSASLLLRGRPSLS